MTTETKQLKVVLIDDEQRSRETLRKLIVEYIPEAEVVASAADVLQGIRIIQQHHPDLVFLDIEMPNYSGFKLIEHFEQLYLAEHDSTYVKGASRFPFDIVFTTAYEKYALKAYKAAATGYLMKPIDIDELVEVFKKTSG